MLVAHPTPFIELNSVLDTLAQSICEVLYDKVAEIFLQGSFAVGDFDGNSDVDFIVLLNETLSREDIEQLNVMHHVIFAMDCEWAKHLEGSYFTLAELHGKPGEPVWYLDHGHASLERSNHCNTNVVRWILKHKGILLRQPGIASSKPEEFNAHSFRVTLPEVPTGELRREMRATLLEWGEEILASPKTYDNRFYQGFVVLNFCRMLRDLEAGEVGSKRQGAEWGKRNLPSKFHSLIDRAWLTRPNPSISSRTLADPDDLEQTFEFVNWAIQQVILRYQIGSQSPSNQD